MVRVGADISGLQRGLQQSDNEVRGFGSRIGGAVGSIRSGLGEVTRQAGMAGAGMSAALTAPMVAVGKSALDLAINYQSSMNTLQAVTGATGEQMDRLDRLAVALGADMSLPATSATDATQAMVELAKAGLDVDNVMAAAKGTLQLAAAGQLDNATAAAITAQALNAFSLSGDQATRVADMLAAGANVSAASVADLSQGVQQGGFAFAAAGQPIEHLITSIAALTNVGLTGSDAGTALKNAFIRLMSPTKEAREEMSKLGLSFYDAHGNMLPLPDIIQQLNQATSGMTQEQRNAALETLFMSDGMKAMIPLLDMGKEGFVQLEGQVTKQGAAAELAGAMTKGLGGAIEGLKSQVETFLLTEARPFLDTIEGWVRGVADFIPKLSELPAPVKSAALAFGLAVAAAGPLLLAVSGLAGALGVLLSPIGLVVAGVVALGTAFALNVGGIRDAFVPVLMKVGATIAQNIVPAVQNFIGWLQGFLPTAVGIAAQVFQGLLVPAFNLVAWLVANVVIPAVQMVAEWLGQHLPPVVAMIANVWQNVLAPAIQFAGQLFMWLLPIVLEVAGFLLDMLVPAVNFVVDVVRVLARGWETDWGGIRTVITTVGQVIFTVIGAIWTALKWFADSIGTLFAPAANVLHMIAGEAEEAGQSAGANFTGGVLSGISSGLDDVSKGTGDTYDTLMGINDSVWSGATTIGGNYTGGMSGAIGSGKTDVYNKTVEVANTLGGVNGGGIGQTIGQNWIAGIANGVAQNIGPLDKNIEAVRKRLETLRTEQALVQMLTPSGIAEKPVIAGTPGAAGLDVAGVPPRRTKGDVERDIRGEQAHLEALEHLKDREALRRRGTLPPMLLPEATKPRPTTPTPTPKPAGGGGGGGGGGQSKTAIEATADIARQASEAIRSGLQAIADLAHIHIPPGVDRAADVLARAIDTIVSKLQAVALRYRAGGLEATGNFADASQKVTSALSAAFDLFEKLWAEGGRVLDPANKLVNLAVALGEKIVIIMNELGARIPLWDEFADTKISQFAEASQKVMGGLSAALGFMEALVKSHVAFRDVAGRVVELSNAVRHIMNVVGHGVPRDYDTELVSGYVAAAEGVTEALGKSAGLLQTLGSEQFRLPAWDVVDGFLSAFGRLFERVAGWLAEHQSQATELNAQLAGWVGDITDAFSKVLDLVRSLGEVSGDQSFEVRSTVIDQLFGALEHMLTSFSERSRSWAQRFDEYSVELAGWVGDIAGGLGAAIQPLIDLSGLREIPISGIDMFFTGLDRVLAEFARRSEEWKGRATEEAAKLAAHMGDVAESLGRAVQPLLDIMAFAVPEGKEGGGQWQILGQGVAMQQDPVSAAIDAFFGVLDRVLAEFARRSEEWKGRATEEAAKLAANIGSVMDMVGAAIEPILKMADAQKVQAGQIEGAMANVWLALHHFNEVMRSGELQGDWKERAVEFATALGTVFERTREALGVLDQMGDGGNDGWLRVFEDVRNMWGAIFGPAEREGTLLWMLFSQPGGMFNVLDRLVPLAMGFHKYVWKGELTRLGEELVAQMDELRRQAYTAAFAIGEAIARAIRDGIGTDTFTIRVDVSTDTGGGGGSPPPLPPSGNSTIYGGFNPNYVPQGEYAFMGAGVGAGVVNYNPVFIGEQQIQDPDLHRLLVAHRKRQNIRNGGTR